MQTSTTSTIEKIRRAANQFMEDDCLTLAASLAYYTVFALPPLLFLLVTVVSWGMAVGYGRDVATERAQAFLQQQAGQLIGSDAAGKEIGTMIKNSAQEDGVWWKSMLSIIGVVLGATGLVGALQSALNRVWKVKPRPGPLAWRFVIKRFISLAMIMSFGFMLLVSFVIATILSVVTGQIARWIGLEAGLTMFANQTVSFAMSWAFFAATFRFMPDAKVPWKHAIIGGLLAVVLFTVGRWVLFAYLSAADPGKPLGSAAGSLVVILLWVYYTSSLMLYSAEVTANITDKASEPEPGAVGVVESVVAKPDLATSESLN
jgi:membrane protein